LIAIGLKRLRNTNADKTFSVSIIIAARNEQKRIRPCLESLEKLNYPADKYEIIFVDDNSSDNTMKLIRSFSDQYDNWHCIHLEEKSAHLRGKKNALLHGIKAAKGELIFTTDADCIIPSDWLRKMVNYFQPGISMILGYSPLLKSNKFYFRLLQFDNLFSAIAAAAPAKLGYPFTSVGRNLAYRKESYENMGGFLSLKKFRSGDDIHLTGQFRHNNHGKIDYCADSDTFVSTQIPLTTKELYQQQLRKNSKTFQLSAVSISVMLTLFLYYILIPLMPVLNPMQIIAWLVLILIKMFLEFLVLVKAAKIFSQKDLIPHIPLMQIIYPIYIIFFSIIGAFQLYQWKK
jgi:cellulose synthase/poly-beta-1,6-N-acetylglucosamine synthase-like glycosyltransferase